MVATRFGEVRVVAGWSVSRALITSTGFVPIIILFKMIVNTVLETFAPLIRNKVP